MKWGGFQEQNGAWYVQGNQSDPDWYTKHPTATGSVGMYEYSTVIEKPTIAAMSYVAPQDTIRIPPPETPKLQYFNPAGLGTPTRERLVYIINPRGIKMSYSY
jgi:hypothetical protein